MKINPNLCEVIPFEDFELGWRWSENHNNNVPLADLANIKPLSTTESKRIYKAIEYFESEHRLSEAFESTEWFVASSDTQEDIAKFSECFKTLAQPYDENLYISWNRKTCLYTTKEIFIAYWDDFCYPSSDNITIISELTNWVFFYNHIQVGRFWKRKLPTNSGDVFK